MTPILNVFWHLFHWNDDIRADNEYERCCVARYNMEQIKEEKI